MSWKILAIINWLFKNLGRVWRLWSLFYLLAISCVVVCLQVGLQSCILGGGGKTFETKKYHNSVYAVSYRQRPRNIILAEEKVPGSNLPTQNPKSAELVKLISIQLKKTKQKRSHLNLSSFLTANMALEVRPPYPLIEGWLHVECI